MSLPDKLYAWTDTNATPNTYYTDNTAIAVDMPLYNNQGEDTGETIGLIHENDKFEIYDKYEYKIEDKPSSNYYGTNYVTSNFTPKRNGYYKITLIGGGGGGYFYDHKYEEANDEQNWAFSGGAGGCLILEVYLQSSITYLLTIGKQGYMKRKSSVSAIYGYKMVDGGTTSIGYSNDNDSYYIKALGASAGDSDNGSQSFGGQTYIDNNAFNIRKIILNQQGADGILYTCASNIRTQAIPGTKSVLGETTYGASMSVPSSIELDENTYGRSCIHDYGGYICIELIDS